MGSGLAKTSALTPVVLGVDLAIGGIGIRHR
jgi:hypothetical protein